jgi:hypothetical protein
MHVVGLSAIVQMSQIQKRLLICVAHILFIAEYPPQHGNQSLPVRLHSGQYPPLAGVNRAGDN